MQSATPQIAAVWWSWLPATLSSTPVYPAAHAIDHGIAVGAVDRDRSLAGFSNRAGSRPMDYVTAPGVSIYSAVPGGGYDSFNGTSMATLTSRSCRFTKVTTEVCLHPPLKIC